MMAKRSQVFVCGQTDRYDVVSSRFSQFCECAKLKGYVPSVGVAYRETFGFKGVNYWNNQSDIKHA